MEKIKFSETTSMVAPLIGVDIGKFGLYRLNISFIQHNAGLQLVDFFHQWEARNALIYRDIMLIYRDL